MTRRITNKQVVQRLWAEGKTVTQIQQITGMSRYLILIYIGSPMKQIAPTKKGNGK